MINCAIFAIGEELLEGSVTDTNSAFIAGLLAAAGISPKLIQALPDDGRKITSAIKKAMRAYPLVVTTGGLGPTFDDLTPDAVAAACGKGLVLYDEVRAHVIQRLSRLGVHVNDNHLKQALLPADATLFSNPHGTAYGFGVEHRGSIVISMPGVPAEMKPMLTEKVMPLLNERFKPQAPYRATLRFGNLPESDLDTVIRSTGIPENVQCIINAGSGDVLVKVRSADYESGEAFAEAVKNAFPKQFYGDDGLSPAEILINLLRNNNMTISVAESCTGGLLGGAITAIGGASDVFAGGVISYSNEVKINQLGVSREIIEKFGAVSEECAVAMAEGVQKLLKTDCAISVTGIAGPSGGTPEKPIGTVWLGFRINGKTVSKLLLNSGGRDDIRERSVKRAIVTMIQLLQNK